MVYLVIMGAVLLVFLLLVVMLLLLPGKDAKFTSTFVSAQTPKEPTTSVSANSAALNQTPMARPGSQQLFGNTSLSAGWAVGGTTQMPGGTRSTGPIPRVSPPWTNIQNSSGIAGNAHSSRESGILFPPPSSPPLQSLRARKAYELEMEYERGMRTIYDEQIGAVNFIGMHVVMNTPAEVELAFHVCKRQIRNVLRSKGLERAPTLTDICGIVIGRDATEAWGQALKEYLEEMCIKVGKDTYLLAHYNSRADQPDQNQLQEKIRRIQFMTAAAINHFQSNIFDTREEAVAFLQRMREVYQV
jgi:hypothetical protein